MPIGTDLAPADAAGRIGKTDLYDGVAAWSKGDVLFIVCVKPASPERVHQTALWAETFLTTLSDDASFAACQILLPSAKPPGRAARAEARRMLEKIAGRGRLLVTVPVGGGLWQGIVTAIIRAALLLTRKGKIVKIAPNHRVAFSMLDKVATSNSPSLAELEVGLDLLQELLELPADAVRRGLARMGSL